MGKAAKLNRIKKIKAAAPAYTLPSGWQMLQAAWRTLWADKWLYGGIAVIYGLLSAIFVHFPLSVSTAINQKFVKDGNGLSAFISLLTTNGSTDKSSGLYQVFILIIVSLAMIYALRRSYEQGESRAQRIKTAFYDGMYPLVQTFVVILVLLLQCLPVIIATALYGLLITTIPVAPIMVVGGLIVLAAIILSLRLVSSTLLALYIVTLPNVLPMTALRSARQLVVGRRFTVLRKQLFLPLVVLAVLTAVVLPTVYVFTVAAALLVFILLTLLLPIVHSYYYQLYRELIRDEK